MACSPIVCSAGHWALDMGFVSPRCSQHQRETDTQRAYERSMTRLSVPGGSIQDCGRQAGDTEVGQARGFHVEEQFTLPTRGNTQVQRTILLYGLAEGEGLVCWTSSWGQWGAIEESGAPEWYI